MNPCSVVISDCKVSMNPCSVERVDCRVSMYPCSVERVDCRVSMYPCSVESVDCKVSTLLSSVVNLLDTDSDIANMDVVPPNPITWTFPNEPVDIDEPLMFPLAVMWPEEPEAHISPATWSLLVG